MRHSDPHCEWIAHAASLLWKFRYKFIRMNDRNIVALPHCEIKRHLKVNNLQLMFDKRSTGIPIPSAQLEMSALTPALGK